MDLVTESLTLIAGKGSRPSSAAWYSRFTPVVVSSVTPRICARRVEYQPGWLSSRLRIAAYRATSSSLAGFEISEASCSARLPSMSSSVASPPSSRIEFANWPPGHSKMRCVNSQYSSSDSPLYANTGVPPAAIAAAA